MARVLYMDDDIAQGHELATALREIGHEVVVATSSKQAREELYHWDFDILITDMIVRRDGRVVSDGGLALISWARHQRTMSPELRHLPIIAISGMQSMPAMGFILPTAEKIGADLVFEKPVAAGRIADAVKELCEPG